MQLQRLWNLYTGHAEFRQISIMRPLANDTVELAFIPDDIQIVTTYENLAYGIYGSSLEVYHQVAPRKTRHEYTLMADFDMEICNPDALVIGGKFTV